MSEPTSTEQIIEKMNEGLKATCSARRGHRTRSYRTMKTVKLPYPIPFQELLRLSVQPKTPTTQRRKKKPAKPAKPTKK